MKSTKAIFLVTIGIVAIGFIFLYQQYKQTSNTPIESTIYSPYVGQETRSIKALSQEDIDGLLTGAGTPFGGMAKPAELNGYPGPRHILDAVEAGELELTAEQLLQVEKLYGDMRSEAIVLGEKIIAIETEIDEAFASKTMTEDFLRQKIVTSSGMYGQLRVVHLKYHLSMLDVLTPQQVSEYNKLRGYTSGNPCENIPAGHDAEAWKLHNNCD